MERKAQNLVGRKRAYPLIDLDKVEGKQPPAAYKVKPVFFGGQLAVEAPPLPPPLPSTMRCPRCDHLLWIGNARAIRCVNCNERVTR